MFRNKLAKLCALLVLAGCATAAPGSSVFEQTEAFLGDEITVSGHLKFGFENRNLYPTQNWERDWDKDRCIPIGIGWDDEETSALAKSLDGQFVEVSGTVDTLLSDDDINASFCKKIGLRVSNLRAK